MQTLKPTLTIDIWSDLVCPWCWIAKKRFEQGLNSFEFRDQVVIRHHSYRLAGGSPTMPFKDAIVKKLSSQHSAELMMNQVGTAGKSEGLIYNFDSMMFGDTEDAHTLLTAARKAGIADAVEERFYRGSITEGRSLFDRQELVALAVEAGMAKSDAEASLENDALRASVAEDEAHARAIGVSGVPVFVMNEKYALSGAQSADNFLNALRQVWDEQQTELSVTAGQTCGTEGCSI
ncbi:MULTISPECIES: DsbA family oxidoreductase [Pectobacterium]|uniref:Isomerase n=2 Tax=Pectobacterium TaxID=122277 RepID=A0AAI9KZI1_PECCC|nr:MULTISPECIES: DsbA family oxidoreductase [Pectobacterium]MCQ8232093.1 DsbA family oxidoreductase [Pectobacterium carotovorum]UVO09314.1 DsbA family oxidoreductase [Pectobacterium polonicum]GKW07588.1 isomerase [Pectobacterium carotovorum subsp. carotovorum]GKX46604.1 isomerase [Pectobacterium carotovorum subsp. carotovorum]GLV68624.1 isomerase [Pectobacterium carotovorum subsp. carotovorum]